jgi:hypothetical protein
LNSAAIADLDKGAAKFARIAQQHLAAQLMHQRLLAIADAQDRQAAFQNGLGMRGPFSSSTLAGEPDRMMPWASSAQRRPRPG